MKRFRNLVLALSLGAAMLVPTAFASADAATTGQGDVKTDAQTAAGLGLLTGDGSGVNDAYLAKGSTRIQAAIISLRLQGKLSDATAYKGGGNFADAKLVGKSNQAIMAFLKNHPEYGWNGIGGNRFDPLSPISAQQLYKVLLEASGYKSGKDFAYADTETFAAGKGLTQIAGVHALTNSNIATALVEALSATTAHGDTLFDMLKSGKVIPASAAMPQGERIGMRTDAKLGTYFTDKKGRTLYFYSKDSQDLNSCQGQCIANWPVFASEHLQIPAGLNPADFTVLTRTDGTKQWMYKGWPLYYFVKDAKAGDVLGEGVGGVWFVAKSDYSVMLGSNTDLGNYLTDDHGRTLYYFTKDMPGMSACDGTCLANWPVYGKSGGSVPSTLNKADFGTITRADGTKQATFKGYPLYYFVKDMAHGDVTGQNVGSVWFVIDPAKFMPAGSGDMMGSGSNAGGGTGTGTGTGSGTSAGDQSNVKTYHIDIKDYSFGSGPLTVEAGSKIVFTNMDDVKHNAVAVDGSFKIPLLAKGESATITLDKPGTYDYYCEPHKSFMTGQIIVK
ncbi:plastocyanin/azurin family copper-binding protein [Paenibacillus humicola]|uniref:plastocyanin/azurin family copper-binding protein n=1 Tax=Paenibacillus humicola TaxID=3110540 RepID=UPI00237B1729|nr:plastocyanin/azurin family copper-binding protein [Paenibacillus humicola]